MVSEKSLEFYSPEEIIVLIDDSWEMWIPSGYGPLFSKDASSGMYKVGDIFIIDSREEVIRMITNVLSWAERRPKDIYTMRKGRQERMFCPPVKKSRKSSIKHGK